MFRPEYYLINKTKTMKRILAASLAFVMLTISFIACQKSATAPAKNTNLSVTADQWKALARGVNAYYQSNVASGSAGKANRAEFIVPFFSFEVWGFIKIDPAFPDVMQIVFMGGQLGPRDFYRQNPDGTVSVHISLHNASAFYIPNANDENSPVLFGSGGRYSSDYTGPVIDFGNGFKIIDLANLRNAAVTGSCKVSETGDAPWKTLLLKFISNPGGQTQTEFSIH